jgi:ribose transport system substrate-binding protein
MRVDLLSFDLPSFVISFRQSGEIVSRAAVAPMANAAAGRDEMRVAESALVLLAIAMTAMCISCSQAAHTGERYVFIASNINIPYWQDAKAGLLDSAKRLDGAKVEFQGPARYSPDDELKAFQDAVASKPDGILLSPGQPEPFKDAIDSAVAAGIPVICADSDAPLSHRVLFIGTDNYQAGLQSGNTMAKLLNGRGGIVVIKITGQNNQEERARGVRDAVKKYPALAVAIEVNDSGDAQQAGQSVAGMIQNGGHPDGIICLEASCGPGVAQALDKLGMANKIPIVAMDANPETLDRIAQGYVVASVAQKPYTMGFYGLEYLDDLHHNRVHEFPDWRTAPASPLPSIVDTGTAVVDSSNVQTYLAAIAHPK